MLGVGIVAGRVGHAACLAIGVALAFWRKSTNAEREMGSNIVQTAGVYL